MANDDRKNPKLPPGEKPPVLGKRSKAKYGIPTRMRDYIDEMIDACAKHFRVPKVILYQALLEDVAKRLAERAAQDSFGKPSQIHEVLAELGIDFDIYKAMIDYKPGRKDPDRPPRSDPSIFGDEG